MRFQAGYLRKEASRKKKAQVGTTVSRDSALLGFTWRLGTITTLFRRRDLMSADISRD